MKRFEQIDFVRGALLIIMTIDHFHSILQRFTYQTFGYVSAAEGFVFVSGLVAGIVYGRRIDKFGTEKVYKKIFSRAWEIYLYHIIILTILTILIQSLDYIRVFWKNDQLLYDHPVLGWVLGALFLYQPDHLNILPIYCIFLFFTPFAFHLLLRGRFFLLMFLSIGLWIGGLMGLQDVLSTYLERFIPVNLGYFNIFSWQLLFFFSIMLGYLKKEGKLEVWMHNQKLLAVCIVLGILLFFFKVLEIDPEIPYLPLTFLIDRPDLGPLRVFNFAVLSYIISYLLVQYKNAGKFYPVVYLGQHSLQVFVFHVLVTILLVPLVYNLEFHMFDNAFINRKAQQMIEVCVALLAVFSLFIPANLRDRIIRKKRIKVS